MARKSFHSSLPEDCWELIFKFLHEDHHHRYLEPLSLVSKQFLSITNRLRFSLTLCDQTLSHLFLHRFPNLISIDITRCTNHGNLDALLIQISKSPLQLKSLNLSNHPILPSIGLRALAKKMKTLKSLICSNTGLINADVFLINECYPFLEELDISFPIYSFRPRNKPDDDFTRPLDDFGLKALSLLLPKLKKINLSGNRYIDDESLFHLCKNRGEFLQEIVILHCPYITVTDNGFALAIHQVPSLSSISVTSHFIQSLGVNLKGLTCLDLSSSTISDKLLYSIEEKCLPLRKLVFQNCSGYTYAAMFCLLSKCQLLQHLDLQNAKNLLNDRRVNKLSQILRCLFYINLNGSSLITNSALFALLRNCPFISDIRMERTGIGKRGVEEKMDSVVNTQVKSLYLASNGSLVDESIKIFASMCPNLQLLDLTDCFGISTTKGEGVVEVLRKCCKIRHLSYASLRQLPMNFQVPNLEVLTLFNSSNGDEALSVISKSCCGLLHLDLVNCINVTAKGVREVVENCTQLREIHLGHCHRVDANVVDWMIVSRPSLRKITAPPSFQCSDSQRELLLLRQGCLVMISK